MRARLKGWMERTGYWLRTKKGCKHCCMVCEYYDICRDMENGENEKYKN